MVYKVFVVYFTKYRYIEFIRQQRLVDVRIEPYQIIMRQLLAYQSYVNIRKRLVVAHGTRAEQDNLLYVPVCGKHVLQHLAFLLFQPVLQHIYRMFIAK